MSVSNHLEQRLLLTYPVNLPGRVKYFVSTMFRVGLCEHHEFDVGRVSTQTGVCRNQVFDLVF